MGLQTGNTVLSAYIVDCYPLQSMSVITFYSVVLDLSAFTNPVSPAPLPTLHYGYLSHLFISFSPLHTLPTSTHIFSNTQADQAPCS